ncbi:protein SEC13 homolog [Daktulosphaira vitifoliae]|uniref:protein SEC13 homolog n=1 Tax=Daktulosphaira vitifoliae TaxID=58002 RepID=UPI0021AA6752|nr:protein SEC13 homolog [Daktulosphaira vitifoliae]
MLSVLNTSDSTHQRQILSSDIDYYSRFVCTSSADGIIQIVDTIEANKNPTIELKDHVGPVWQVSFSYPKFGFLASCGSDCKLIVRKINKSNQWVTIYSYDGHTSSVKAISWAPHKIGALIACASADGTISIHTYNDHKWDVSKIPNAHLNGVNSLSWAPYLINKHKVILSGGNDCKIKIWKDEKCAWNLLHESDNQLAIIRDVSWCPSPGIQKYMIASCSSDGRVIIWESDDCCDWKETEINDPEKEKWKVSWSHIGNILSITMNNYVVKFYKQMGKNKWLCLNTKIADNLNGLESTSKKLFNQDIFSSLI